MQRPNDFPLSTFQDEQARFRELRALIKKYDEDKSGDLDASELTKCIQVYSDTRQWTMDPVSPTDEEISLLLKASSNHKQGTVDASEIEYILSLWHSYVANRKMIQTVFDKYDTDCNQKLEFDQLKSYLTDLNEGHTPQVALASCLGLETGHFQKHLCQIYSSHAWYRKLRSER